MNKKEEIKKKKTIGKSSDTTATTATTATSDRTATTNNLYQFEHVTWDVGMVFQEILIDDILRNFYDTKNTPISLANLALKIGKNKDSIRATINRRKEIFNDTSVRGKAGVIQLLQVGINEIESRIKEYGVKMEEKKKRELELKQEKERKLSKDEELLIEAKEFFNSYKKSIGHQLKQGNSSIIINFKDLAEFSLKLSDEVISNPEDILRIFESAFEQMGLKENIRIRIINLPEDCKIFIENIRAKHLNGLILVEGRVVSITDVRPQVINAKFECPSCGTVISVLQMEKKFREPIRCSCGRRGGFKLISKDMVDTARIILEDLQEKTDNPHTRRLNIFIKEDLTSPKNIKMFTPGNEIKIVGILKEVPVPLRSGGASIRFDLAVEVNSVELSEEEVDINKFTEQEIEDIKILSNKIDKEGLEEINGSFAPNVYGYEEIKNAIIFQLCNKKNEPKKVPVRNKPNILLIGDPGTAKSELGKFTVEITPGSRTAMGGGSSAVGITASVIREEGEGYRVEPGAMVIAKEILFLDELNNLSDEDKPKLQEGMGEQSITINKANIHMKMKVTAGVLAAANPITGFFTHSEDMVKQFNLPAAIINRFDEIFVMTDLVNEDMDRSIARRMISRERGKIKPNYSKDFLKKFFVYIRNFPEPIISDLMAQRLEDLYSKLRRYKQQSININARIHEALLRILKSSAKIRLSDKIEEKDVERAINILSKSHYNIPSYESFEIKEEKIESSDNQIKEAEERYRKEAEEIEKI